MMRAASASSCVQILTRRIWLRRHVTPMCLEFQSWCLSRSVCPSRSSPPAVLARPSTQTSRSARTSCSSSHASTQTRRHRLVWRPAPSARDVSWSKSVRTCSSPNSRGVASSMLRPRLPLKSELRFGRNAGATPPPAHRSRRGRRAATPQVRRDRHPANTPSRPPALSCFARKEQSDLQARPHPGGRRR